MTPAYYRKQVQLALTELGIDPALIKARGLVLHKEVARLAVADLGTDGRDKFLAPVAATAWRAMRHRAGRAGVDLQLISGFRSVVFQAALLRSKLKRGDLIEEILRVNAPPGYSEHHSGRAVDIGTAEVAPLDESFERTPAFAWLTGNAKRFGFALSYPRGNRQGYLYEPWHWCYRTQK